MESATANRSSTPNAGKPAAQVMNWLDLSYYGMEMRLLVHVTDQAQTRHAVVPHGGDNYSVTLSGLGFIRDSANGVWHREASLEVQQIQGAFPHCHVVEVPKDDVIVVVDARTPGVVAQSSAQSSAQPNRPPEPVETITVESAGNSEPAKPGESSVSPVSSVSSVAGTSVPETSPEAAQEVNAAPKVESEAKPDPNVRAEAAPAPTTAEPTTTISREPVSHDQPDSQPPEQFADQPGTDPTESLRGHGQGALDGIPSADVPEDGVGRNAVGRVGSGANRDGGGDRPVQGAVDATPPATADSGHAETSSVPNLAPEDSRGGDSAPVHPDATGDRSGDGVDGGRRERLIDIGDSLAEDADGAADGAADEAIDAIDAPVGMHDTVDTSEASGTPGGTPDATVDVIDTQSTLGSEEPSSEKPSSEEPSSEEQVGPSGTVVEIGAARAVSGIVEHPKNPEHFFIADEIDREGGYHPKERFAETLAAITLLNKIEGEGRPATIDDKMTLAQFAGFGGMQEALDPHSSWRAEYQALRAVVGEKDYTSLQTTVLNAHYTSPDLVEAMWATVERMGFEGGRVLEPSVGVGNFLGMAPASIVAKSDFIAVEKDQLSARIASVLYPDTKVYGRGYEDVTLPDRFVDLAIGNIPFGRIQPVSNSRAINARYDRYRYPVHDYFIAKTLGHLKPGGVMAFVTSRYTLDKTSNTTRERIEAQADFLGAVRLPEQAHQSQAGTKAITDIVFLKKRLPGETVSQSKAWVDTLPISFTAKTPEGEEKIVNRPINQYFVDHPEMVVGEMGVGSLGFRGGEVTVSFSPSADTPTFGAALNKALDNLPRNVVETAARTDVVEPIATKEAVETRPSDGSLIQGSYVVMDSGKIGKVQGEVEVEMTIPKSHQARVSKMIPIRDLTDQLLQTEARPHSPDDECEALRGRLNQAYSEFVADHGRLSDAINKRAFRGDPRASLLLSLEQIDKDGKFVDLSTIFEQRVIKPIQLPEPGMSVNDAYKATLAHYGKVVPDVIARLSEHDWEDVEKDLVGQIFKNPENDTWETAEQYLSGNVREKLDVARQAADIDPGFIVNVDALEKSQPEPLDPGQIHVHMGAPWLDENDVRDFILHVMNVGPYYSDSVHIFHNPVDGRWEARMDPDLSSISSEENREQWGTSRVSAIRLIQQALNQRIPKVTDKIETDDGKEKTVVNTEETLQAQMKQTKLKNEFTSWLWSDPERTERATEEYNRMYNNIRTPRYDGSHLTFPGINQAVNLHQHQKDAIWQAVQCGNIMLAHEVGAGKTWAMVAIAHEWKRLGKANKPLITVPNHMLGQFTRESRELFPAARILAVDKSELGKNRRQEFIARVATGDWDMVIMTHASFSRIGVSSTRKAAFIEAELNEYRTLLDNLPADASRQTKKGIETKIENMKTSVQRALDSSKDDAVSFEQMGIDAVIVDESQDYKNLDIRTSIEGVTGLNTKGSDRSMDMLLKTRYLYEKRGSVSGVVFASGTPITNAIPGEVYTLQRYLQPDVMRTQGTQSFDAFASVYTDPVPVTEIDVSCSEYKQRTRLTMVNTPELISSLSQVMDIKTQSDLKLPKPALKTTYVEIERTPDQAAFMADLAGRVQELKHPDPTSRDNMLLIGTDGRKVSLDMRVVDPTFPDDPSSKINRVAEEVYSRWQKYQPERAAQLVFIDLSVPKKNDWNLYDDLKDKLLAKGIPPEEIAYVHDAGNDAAKEKLFAMVRAGDIRVLLGSSQKMGTGTNVQERLIAIHQVDPSWRPDIIEQRRGRIARQGNRFGEVEELLYTTTDTFDLYMWQSVQAKATEIHRIMHGDKSIRSYNEDVDPTYAELMAITTGNPLIREKLECDNAIGRLEVLRNGHLRDIVRAGRSIRDKKYQVAANEVEKSFCWSIVDQRGPLPPEGKGATWRFNGKAGGKDAVMKELKKVALQARVNGRVSLDGLTIQGVPVRCFVSKEGGVSAFEIRNDHDAQNWRYGAHVERYILDGANVRLKWLEDTKKSLANDLKRYEEAASAPFEGQQELDHLLEKRTRLILALDKQSDQEQPVNRDIVDKDTADTPKKGVLRM